MHDTMNISIHRLKVNERASEETLSFTADVHINGKLAFMAENKGCGGPCAFTPAREQYPKWPRGVPKRPGVTSDPLYKKQMATYHKGVGEVVTAVNAVIEQAEAYADSLPEVPYGCGMEGTFQQDLDSLIHGMASQQHEFNEARKRLQRTLTNKCLWLHVTKPGVMTVVNRTTRKDMPYTPELAIKMKTHATWVGLVRVILNELDINEATKLTIEAEDALSAEQEKIEA